MKIYSEKTKQEYKTVEACLEAEAAYDKEQEDLKAKREAAAAEKRVRAAEVEEAYKAATEAGAKYYELRDKFVKDYGYYHMTYRSPANISTRDIFDTIFNFF